MANFIFKKHGDKLLFALALAVLATALIRVVAKPAIQQAKTRDIVFTQWWDNYLEKDTLTELIKEFEDTNEGIKIILNPVSYENMHKELTDQSESSVANTIRGDLFAMDTLWVPAVLEKKIIENADIEVPLLRYINVLYYNVEILKEAGFSRPPKTRGEFLNYAKALKSENANVWALTLGLNSSRGIYDDIFPWMWAAGLELIKDGNPAIDSRPVTESLSFLASLERDGLIVPGGLQADAEKKLEDFVSGRAAFMIAPTRDIEFVRERMGEEAFSITSVPVPDNYAGKTYIASADWTLGVSAESLLKEETRLFADFVAQKTETLADKARAIPGNSITGNTKPDPFYSKAWDIAISGEITRDFNGLQWEQLEKIFYKELSLLFEGTSSPAETATATHKGWEALLLSQ